MRFGKLLIFILIALAIFILVNFALARELEVPLPQIGEEPAITETPLLPTYVKYIFNFGIGIAGLIAFVVIVYGGVRYLTSAGNPTAMGDANNQIFSGLIGLVVILGSWLLLTTINPQLIIISPQLKESGLVAQDTPGVYLCKDAAREDCQVFTKSTPDLGALNNQKPLYVKFKNPTKCKAECKPEDCDEPRCREVTDRYGAVFHEDKDYKDDCQVVLSDSQLNHTIRRSEIGGDGASSITIFRQREGNGKKGATVYKHKEYNERDKEKQYQVFSVGEYKDFKEYRFINCEGGWGRCDLDDRISSIKVVDGYMAVLFEGANFTDHCEVFLRNDPNLAADNYIGNDAASSLRVLPIK